MLSPQLRGPAAILKCNKLLCGSALSEPVRGLKVLDRLFSAPGGERVRKAGGSPERKSASGLDGSPSNHPIALKVTIHL